MIQRVLCVQCSHSRSRTAHPARCAQLEKAHLSNELLFHTVMKAMKYSQKCRQLMKSNFKKKNLPSHFEKKLEM